MSTNEFGDCSHKSTKDLLATALTSQINNRSGKHGPLTLTCCILALSLAAAATCWRVLCTEYRVQPSDRRPGKISTQWTPIALGVNLSLDVAKCLRGHYPPGALQSREVLS